MSDTVAGPGELRTTLGAELRLFAAAEPAALRATKRIVALANTAPLPAALDAAALEFAGPVRHGDGHDGMAAARGTRALAWRGFVPELPGFL
jgi:isohexenylglutaconyl-CoA hydratase